MKAKYWVFFSSFCMVLVGAMYISIYFVQYRWLGIREMPKTEAGIEIANKLTLIYGSYGVSLFIVGMFGIFFRDNPRRLRFLMNMGILSFVSGFFSGSVNYLVYLKEGHTVPEAVMCVLTSLALPIFFIHTTYLGRLEFAESLEYEDVGDDKDKDL